MHVLKCHLPCCNRTPKQLPTKLGAHVVRSCDGGRKSPHPERTFDIYIRPASSWMRTKMGSMVVKAVVVERTDG